MNYRTILIVLVAVAVIAVGCWYLARPAIAAADGVIEGQVKNGTPDGGVPAGLIVTLHILDGDRIERRQVTSDGDGRYRFEGLDTSPGLKYLPIVEYHGATYYPRPLSFAEPAATNSQTADITVYEPTSSDRWIAFERANLLVRDVAADRVDVTEMGSLANAGDRTYLGAEASPVAPRPTLRFSVPAGAVDLAPQLGFAPNDISPDPGGFSIASPVVPGRRQIAFSYSLPATAGRLRLDKRLDYPVMSLNLYVPDVGIQVDSAQLEPQGPADLGGQRFLVYSAQNLPRGAQLSLQIGGLPSAVGGKGLAEQLVWPLLGVGSVILAAGLAVASRRTVRSPGDRVSEPTSNGHVIAERTELERMQLLLSLARLDERYERGDLPEDRYRRERAAGKHRLVTLSRPGSRTEAGGG
jgi:hypothetical protein